MKKKLMISLTGIVLSVGMTGCVTVTMPTLKTGPGSISSSTSPNSSGQTSGKDTGCGVVDDPRYDTTRHFNDKRWCSNLTMPGGYFSKSYRESVVVKGVGLEEAYLRSKNFLKFLGPNDEPDQYSGKAKWDEIRGYYYSIEDRFGGPMKRMDWYADYKLELKKFGVNQVKVTITYKVYSKGMNPKDFFDDVVNHIKN